MTLHNYNKSISNYYIHLSPNRDKNNFPSVIQFSGYNNHIIQFSLSALQYNNNATQGFQIKISS